MTVSAPVGTVIVNNSTTIQQNSTWTNTTSWWSYNCIGGRGEADATAGLTQTLKVGSTVTWNAGFKVYNNATATTTLAAGSGSDLTYTLVDAGSILPALCAAIVAPIIVAMF